ncbi:MAG: hypothetical protein PVI03_01250 [Candidatus Thorarchaeota archaeon]|jgi:hypothetical protein
MSATSSIVGLIPVAVASGIAVQTQRSLLKEQKRKRKRTMKSRAKKRPSKKQVKRVTKSRRSSRQAIDKWIG